MSYLRFLSVFGLLFFLAGCSFNFWQGQKGFSQEPSINETTSLFRKNQENLGVVVTMQDVADRDLHKILQGLPEKYAQNSKNISQSKFTNLTKTELKKVLQLENVNLENVVDKSIKQVGEDIYYIVSFSQDNSQVYEIYCNHEKIRTFASEKLNTYDPLISVRVIANQYTVEYISAKINTATNNLEQEQRVWQAGVGELTEYYSLQAAIMPFETNGHLIFLAQKDQNWFVMLDGKVVSDTFQSINFGYTAESALFQPKAFNYRYYVFFASKAGRQKLVEVDCGGENLTAPLKVEEN